MKGLLGKKIGMTTIFDDAGNKIPVTMLEAGPCYVVRKKAKSNDGYDAVVLGYEKVKEKALNKPKKGVFEKSKVPYLRHLKEFEFDSIDKVETGKEIKVDIFREGEKVSVSGIGKGKGFQGVVKRYGFRGGPKTHGQSHELRAPGSIGNSAWPSRVWKGKKMPGRMGQKKSTIRNMLVVKIIKEKNLIFVKGSVPGIRGTLLEIKN